MCPFFLSLTDVPTFPHNGNFYGCPGDDSPTCDCSGSLGSDRKWESICEIPKPTFH